MTPERPPRRRQPNTHAGDSVFVRLRMRLLPPVPDPYEGKRIGRPERSPSLPPPDDAADTGAGPPAAK